MAANPDRVPILVSPDELPVFCPSPGMPLWSAHPRVFLDIMDTGEAMCPYCGTIYRLQDRPREGGH